MDFSKYPLEKFFYFLAGVIPGFVALLILQLATPGRFGWFFGLGFLGYRTKLSLIVLAAFVVGNSLTTFLSAFLGAIGGAWGSVLGMRPYRPSASYDAAPWRDPRWRSVLRNRIGTQAPNNTPFIWQALYDLRCRQVNLIPAEEQPAALAALNQEKIQSDMNDSEWELWYDHYHRIVLQPNNPDPVLYVRRGLNFNLETTALYVLISAAVVPSLREWWCILPTCLWVALLVAEEYSSVKRFMDKWSTLSDQIRYLSAGGP